MHLIPVPQSCTMRSGRFDLSESLLIVSTPSHIAAAVELADDIERCSRRRPRFSAEAGGRHIRLSAGNDADAEAYTLVVTAEWIEINGSGERGLFYGIQTLRQMVRGEGVLLPCCEISDRPDYPNRGFLLDLSRGRIPTLERLYRLVDQLAFYKINQLQLYIEHVFEFKGHSDLWSGCDPLTAEEILLLDRYCKCRYVELIPALSTFGHCYTALRSPRKAHLNELESDVSDKPFSFHDRQVHYTLDCGNPDSIRFVESVIKELAPLFHSKYFNICCDETFDLGKGRNRGGDSTALYLEFLKKIMAVVDAQGKIPMFWGDMISHAPEIVRELPTNAVVLEWDYSAECNWYDTEKMRQTGTAFYVCPGCHGWNTFLNDVDTASRNIVNYAAKGKRFGASGLLNTDWGDYGHVNLPANSCHGLALGGAAGWNTAAAGLLLEFDRAFEVLEFGTADSGFCAVWRKILELKPPTWGELQLEFDPGEKNLIPEKRAEFTRTDEFYPLAREFMTLCGNLRPADPETAADLATGMRGLVLTLEIFQALHQRYQGDFYELADRARQFEADFSKRHHWCSRAGEYWRFRELWMRISFRLDQLQRDGTEKNTLLGSFSGFTRIVQVPH